MLENLVFRFWFLVAGYPPSLRYGRASWMLVAGCWSESLTISQSQSLKVPNSLSPTF